MDTQVKDFLSKCWTKPSTASYLEKSTIQIEHVIRIKIADPFTFQCLIQAKAFIIKTAKDVFGENATIFIEKI